MASGERRLGSGRRGMTVLGKIPTPNAPKPINLPSQRLENRGLEPNVDIVPRGTFSWGSAGRSNAVALSKEGDSIIGSSTPTSAVAWNGNSKMQALSAPSNDAGSFTDSRPLSAGSTRPSSAPTAGTASVWGNGAKTKVEIQATTNVLTMSPVEPGPEESVDLTPKQKNGLLNRPTTADGTVLDRHTNSLPGVDAHASAGSQPGSEGFRHPGDGYNSQRNHHHLVWQGMPPASCEWPVVPGPHTGPLPYDVYYSPYDVPQYGNVKDRDMMVVRMPSGPGIYGTFSPHLRPAECFGQPGTYGSYQPAARQVEQFAMSGKSAMVTSSCTPGMSFGFFPDGDKFSPQDGDGQFGAVPRDAGYPSLQRDMDSVRHISSVRTHGTERKQRMSRPFERHNHASKEHETYVKDGVSNFAVPAPDKKITLLTKMPRVEVPNTETIMDNSTLVLNSSQSNEGSQQKAERSIVEAENSTTVTEVKKNSDESLESNKVDGSVAEMTRRDTMSEMKLDVVSVNCRKDTVSEVGTGVSKTFSSQSPKTWRKSAVRSEVSSTTSTQKSRSSTNTQDSEWKEQTSHHFKSDNDGRGHNFSKQGHEGTHLCVISESVGTGSEAVLTEPTRPRIEQDISSRDDQKTKMKALNHKNEKEWRPKSPIVESKFFGHRVTKGGKRDEQCCNADSAKRVMSQECSTGSVLLEASSPSQIQKADRRQGFKNKKSFSSLANSDINFNKEAPLHLVEDPNSSQSRVVEATVDRIENERRFVLEASHNGVHNTARSDDQLLLADMSKVMITEGLTPKGNHKVKMRHLNHKGEKEWRPKSPAVDTIATSDEACGNEVSEAKGTSISISDIDVKITDELQSLEQDGLQPLDAYDYEAQRAKLKEIAAQRAKQRRKEEEERIRERRAKALAKLDELNKRTLSNPTRMEMAEYGSMVPMDEVLNKKTERKFNPCRHSTVDVLTLDAGASEKHYIDEVVQEPVKDSMSISNPTLFHEEYPDEVGMDSKELSSSDLIFPQNSRCKKDDLADRNSSKTAEKHQVHKFQTATSSYKEQRQQSRKETMIAKEDLLSAVHDTEVELSSSKNFGVEIRKDNTRLRRGRRQTDLTQDQTAKVSFMNRNERRGAAEGHQELEPSKLASLVSQIGDSQDNGGFPGKRQLQENRLGGPNQTKAGELPYSEDYPFALGSVERKTFMNAGRGQQSEGNSLSGQKHKSEVEVCQFIEEAQSSGIKRPLESTASSDASFVSEKVSKPHVSWRQKNPSHFFNGDRPSNGIASEESLTIPSQVRKSNKFKNAGGKEHSTSRPEGGHLQVEVVEEKRLSISSAAISEIIAVNADLPKHEVEAKGSDNAKIGRPNNSRRQKNVTNGSYLAKQTSMKEFSERHSESWAVTEAFEEMVDPTLKSNLHHSSPYVRQPVRSGLGAPPWHKHHPMKLSHANLSPGQAGSLVPMEEHSQGQGVSVSRSRSRSTTASTQGWEPEHWEEARNSPMSSQTGKGGARFQAEPTLPLEANAQNQKHQQAKGSEILSGQHLHGSSSRNRYNHTHVENRKMHKHYQAGPQAFRLREHHHEAEFESGNNCAEKCGGSSRGRDKPFRKGQFNGCSTVAELDRRGGEPAVKTEISY